MLLDIDLAAREAAAIDPGLVLDGPVPRLIDEWQTVAPTQRAPSKRPFFRPDVIADISARDCQRLPRDAAALLAYVTGKLAP